MNKRLTLLLALPLAGYIGVALAQSTGGLGPSLTSVSVGATATMAALAANPSRKQLTVCNEHATNTVTLTFGTTPTPVSLTTGRVLAAGNLATSCMTFGSGSKDGSNVGNQLNLIASSVSTPVTVIEYF